MATARKIRASASIDVQGDYCEYPRQATEVSDWEQLTLSELSHLDRAFKLLSRRLSKLSVSKTDVAPLPEHLDEALAFYSEVFQQGGNSFFQRPETAPEPCILRPYELSQGEVFDISFRSRFQPSYPAFHDEYFSFHENQTAYARMWRHPRGKSLGTIFAIHGWLMGDQRINALALLPGFFFRMGLNVVLYELPYHGRRAVRSRHAEKAIFPSAHLPLTNEALAQAIFDLRALLLWLRADLGERGPIGAAGVSLGGYTAALWASLDELGFVIPIVPLVQMEDVAWKLMEECGLTTPPASAIGSVTREQLRRAYAVHCPLNYAPLVPKHRRMIVAAAQDTIIPAEQPRTLWEHWDNPLLYWFNGGHIAEFTRSTAFTSMHDFLISHGLAKQELINVTLL